MRHGVAALVSLRMQHAYGINFQAKLSIPFAILFIFGDVSKPPTFIFAFLIAYVIACNSLVDVNPISLHAFKVF